MVHKSALISFVHLDKLLLRLLVSLSLKWNTIPESYLTIKELIYISMLEMVFEI